MGQVAALAQPEGLILRRYRPLRPLGSGGSGSVWLARDILDEREVALKIVPREGKAGVRAEREAVAVARLRSPHCVRAFSVERDERHVYVAYEYVAGKTLREAIRAGELDDPSAVEACSQLLDVLAHAHHRGVIHRDVKPANALLAEGEGVSVRLLDFGLAQFDEADTLTAAGDVPGTLAYISPERLDGHPATAAADVWSVGVILWEALAGYQPFWSSSPVETARLIGEGAPPLSSARPDLPRRLTDAVDRALSVDPRRRPQPKRLRQELRGALEEQAERRRRRPLVSRRVLVERASHAGLAAGFVALAVSLLSFYPGSWTPVLAAAAALAAFVQPRAGLAFALAVPFLPLGDISSGLAIAYLAVAIAWVATFWNDPRHSLLCVTGPLLGLLGAIALVPLIAERAAGAARRALQAGVAVLLAALAAGLRSSPFPFSGETPPLGLGIAGSDSPGAVLTALWGALAAHPAVGIEAVLLAATAAALPLVRRYGLVGAAALGSILPVAMLLAPPLLGASRVDPVPVLVGAVGLSLALVVPALRERRARDPSVAGGTAKT